MVCVCFNVMWVSGFLKGVLVDQTIRFVDREQAEEWVRGVSDRVFPGGRVFSNFRVVVGG